MTHEQLNDLALRVDARKGVIDKEDLMKLCNVGGVDFMKTFRGVTELDSALINKTIALAHNRITRNDIAKESTVIITGTDEYKANKLATLLKATQPTESKGQLFDRVCSDVWKARKLNKESK